jgi:hypothetical protein
MATAMYVRMGLMAVCVGSLVYFGASHVRRFMAGRTSASAAKARIS